MDSTKLDVIAQPEIIKIDGYLSPYKERISQRINSVNNWLDLINKNEGLDSFLSSYSKFGLNANADGSVTYKEYAPNAAYASLVGDFNNWQIEANKMQSDEFGFWNVTVQPANGNEPAIPHDSKIKIYMKTKDGQELYRLPAWIKYVKQDLSKSVLYDAYFWNPKEKYKFKHPSPLRGKQGKYSHGSLKIYEAHIGISSPEPKVCSYTEFKDTVLKRIKHLGYDAVQLMAIMEHAYYASFGYQVTSFFAVSSRFGTPEEFKELVDEAHRLGLVVLLDVVHSHCSNNVDDGLNMFDGTDYLYFHSGPKGKHELWNSRLFNYGSYETLRFLLSNLCFFMDEYNVDGFRFDGVTSIMYNHHGIGFGFSGNYDEYFTGGTDEEGITYLMLANKILHEKYPHILTIAEDVSGMPGLGRPVDEGGVGFDYKLGMAIPDMWIKFLKEKHDEEWDMGLISFTLTNRRHMEKTISYCESHDQALVGDKSIAFWLMDKEMYTNMSCLSPLTPIIDRGLALHKLVRLITHALGGEGYLNFEGNEFGHPEWLDFPRSGNNSSFHYCRRQFNLIDDELLRYKFLNNFDKALQELDNKYKYMCSPQAYVSLKHETDKIIAFERNGLIFVISFNPEKSLADYRIGCDIAGKYKIVLNSDDELFGGHSRVDNNTEFFTRNEGWCNRENHIQIYIPARTALVFAKCD